VVGGESWGAETRRNTGYVPFSAPRFELEPEDGSSYVVLKVQVQGDDSDCADSHMWQKALGQTPSVGRSASHPTHLSYCLIECDLLINPREFYQVAAGIVTGSPPPGHALCRTAIGRAYFAALNVAVETLMALDVSCGGGAQKDGLTVRYLYASDDEHLKTASVSIDNRRTERNIHGARQVFWVRADIGRRAERRHSTPIDGRFCP
jgi:hypothetical protein